MSQKAPKNRLVPIAIFVLLTALVSPYGLAFTNSAAEALLLNEINLSKVSSQQKIPLSPVVIITNIQGINKIVSQNILSQTIKHSLNRHGIKSTIYRGDFIKDFEGEKLNTAAELLTPKMVLDIHIGRDSSDKDYRAECLLTFIEYPAVQDVTLRAKRNAWSKTCNSQGTSQQDFENNLVQNIQKQLRAFAIAHSIKRKKSSPRTARRYKYRKGTKKSHRMGKVSYSLRFNDLENRANHLHIGATMGTPHIFNLHLGFWGSRSLPLVTGLSGMFFSYEYRAVQFDFGWAFDNTGNTKQAIGIVLAGYNETTPFYTETKDVIGRVTETETGNSYVLKLYMGPLYTLDWNNLRLQLGPVIKIPMDGNQDIKYLLQIGYTIPIRL